LASDKVVEVTTLEALHEILNKYSRVVVDFHAPSWCQPCKRLAPHIEVAAEKNDAVRFIKVDIDQADQSIRDTFPIMSVPTVLYFEDGQQTKEIKGRTAIQILRELDS